MQSSGNSSFFPILYSFHTGSGSKFRNNWKYWSCHKPNILLPHDVLPEDGKTSVSDHHGCRQIIHCSGEMQYLFQKDVYGYGSIFQTGKKDCCPQESDKKRSITAVCSDPGNKHADQR